MPDSGKPGAYPAIAVYLILWENSKSYDSLVHVGIRMPVGPFTGDIAVSGWIYVKFIAMLSKSYTPWLPGSI